MSGPFRRCLGKTACQDDGVFCRTCGRGAEEIARTRALIEALAQVALDYGYDNAPEFFAYVASKAEKKHRYALEQAETAP